MRNGQSGRGTCFVWLASLIRIAGGQTISGVRPRGRAVLFGWLFRKSVSRERAIALAAEHLAANGCCVVASAPDADIYGDAIPYLFMSVTKPSRRWYVEFVRVLPQGMLHNRPGLTVYVWADTGLVTFDPFAGWE